MVTMVTMWLDDYPAFNHDKKPQRIWLWTLQHLIFAFTSFMLHNWDYLVVCKESLKKRYLVWNILMSEQWSQVVTWNAPGDAFKCQVQKDMVRGGRGCVKGVKSLFVHFLSGRIWSRCHLFGFHLLNCTAQFPSTLTARELFPPLIFALLSLFSKQLS